MPMCISQVCSLRGLSTVCLELLQCRLACYGEAIKMSSILGSNVVYNARHPVMLLMDAKHCQPAI